MSEKCTHKNETFKVHKAQKSFSRQWGFISLDDIEYAVLDWQHESKEDFGREFVPGFLDR